MDVNRSSVGKYLFGAKAAGGAFDEEKKQRRVRRGSASAGAQRSGTLGAEVFGAPEREGQAELSSTAARWSRPMEEYGIATIETDAKRGARASLGGSGARRMSRMSAAFNTVLGEARMRKARRHSVPSQCSS